MNISNHKNLSPINLRNFYKNKPLMHKLVINYQEHKRLPPSPIDPETLDEEWKAD